MLLGNVAAVSTAFLWTVSSFAFSNASRAVGAFQLNIDRIGITIVLLGIFNLVAGNLFKINESQILLLGLSGFVGLAFGDTFLFSAYRYIGPRLTIMISALTPAFSAILAYFMLNEHLEYDIYFGMLITLAGILIVVYKKDTGADFNPSSMVKGVIFALLAMFGQALGLILAKQALNITEINSFIATFFRLSSAFIVIFPLTIIAKRYSNPIRIYRENRKALTSVLIGSIFGPFFGITLSLVAISNTDVAVAATLMSTMPILMLPISKYYYKENVTKVAVFGAVLSVIGVVIIFM